ncbi:diphosphomevalonate decarboxylase [Salinispira pacifica]|uniref:Diphosphomevalonate decarboxylase n=1 Tax=Salinispira pacifica TaxID=1307761 RepID=V5WKF1_9SPIO|nr:Diphosphomevalonate decarboxylase [Salinispira pacifica]
MTEACAHPNLALIKYWGKSDSANNLPATSSLGISLDAFHTRTRADFLHGEEQFSSGSPTTPA